MRSRSASEVERTVGSLSKSFPKGIVQSVVYDTTRFVKVSIEEVIITLAEAMILVVLVVYLFLQNWRATFIPVVAVPVSLIGTLAGLLLMGYSINTLTLFGMVLSIGIVVDDAIVVLENVERIMHEEKLSAREAALKAMREVSGPVIAIVLVLCAVFVPIAFLGGLSGELYRQFAVTISMAVIISGIVALSLTPSLCVLILKHEHRNPGRFFQAFNRFFARVTHRYVGGVGFMVRRAGIGLALFAGMVALAAGLWRITPGSLVPDEDQGWFFSAVILPDGASLARTDKVVREVSEIIKSNPANQDVIAFTGFDFLGGGYRNNAATIFVTQKHWNERKQPVPELVGEVFMKTAHIKEALVLAFNPPPIFGLGTAGGFEFYLQQRGEGGAKRLAEVSQQLQGALAQSKLLAGGAQTLWRATVPQLHVDVDRERAKALGVPVDELFNTLSATLGSYYVNDFNKYGRTWQVLMSAESGYRKRPDDIGRMWVRSGSGEMVPVSALAKVKYSSGPEMLDRFNNQPAVKLIGQGAPGVSSGQAIAEVERIAREVLPPDFGFDWGGASYQEKRASGTSALALLLGALMVFLILSAQYEKWSLPLSVMLALPFGTFGALAAVWLRGMTNDVYFQIGLVTLLGLAAKNAILIVQYASHKVHEGMSASGAALEAARLRFRPIIMTSLAFILGVLPLAFSTGAGAGARRSVGTGVMGGMLAATFLAIFFVPMFFKDHHGAPAARAAQHRRDPGRGRGASRAPAPQPARAAPSSATSRTVRRARAARRGRGAGMKSRRITTRAVAFAAAVLAGCAAPPAERHETPQLELPVVAAVVPDVPTEWWKSFNDQRLDALVAEALTNNRDLARAMARIDESRAVLRSAKANQLPRVDANVSGSRQPLRRERTADDRRQPADLQRLSRQPERGLRGRPVVARGQPERVGARRTAGQRIRARHAADSAGGAGGAVVRHAAVARRAGGAVRPGSAGATRQPEPAAHALATPATSPSSTSSSSMPS